jgi:hypothetical protein
MSSKRWPKFSNATTSKISAITEAATQPGADGIQTAALAIRQSLNC